MKRIFAIALVALAAGCHAGATNPTISLCPMTAVYTLPVNSALPAKAAYQMWNRWGGN